MSILEQKDIERLLSAGFSEDDLGIAPGSKRGVTLFETPADYFAKEIIENACEQGECDLWDEILPPNPDPEPYDTSHKLLYEDEEYAGGEDDAIEVPQDLREQAEFLKEINIGKLSLWQARKGNSFKWPVKRISLNMPTEAKMKIALLSEEDRKIFFKSYARDAWQELWRDAVSTLYSKHCEKISIPTSKGDLNLIVIEAEDMRDLGHNIPGEAEWVTLLYFYKDKTRPIIRPRRSM